MTNGKFKSKGLYAEPSLMKNPTMNVCSKMAGEYIKSGTHPSESIKNFTDIRDFVEIRNVKGGGVQYEGMVEVDDWVVVQEPEVIDDWVLVESSDDLDEHWFSAKMSKRKYQKKRPAPAEFGDRLWKRQAWIDEGVDRAPVKRKSKPSPVEVGYGGVKFGRVARWYMSTKPKGPIAYVGSGNKVPSTDGANIMMTLPESLPEDLDYDWYVKEALRILDDLGVMVY